MRARPGRPLLTRDRALLIDLSGQAAPAFRNARLAAALARQVELLDHRSAELEQSRRRLIAARDAERAPGPHRAAAGDALPRHRRAPLETDADADLDELIGIVNAALEVLRKITHGIFPVHLQRAGLTAALRSQLTGTAAVTGTDARFALAVELAAYFCAVEAVELVEPPVRITVAVDDSGLVMTVAGAAVRPGDLSLLLDRLAPLHGRAWVESGSAVRVEIPVAVTAVPTAMTAAAAPG